MSARNVVCEYAVVARCWNGGYAEGTSCSTCIGGCCARRNRGSRSAPLRESALMRAAYHRRNTPSTPYPIRYATLSNTSLPPPHAPPRGLAVGGGRWTTLITPRSSRRSARPFGVCAEMRLAAPAPTGLGAVPLLPSPLPFRPPPPSPSGRWAVGGAVRLPLCSRCRGQRWLAQVFDRSLRRGRSNFFVLLLPFSLSYQKRPAVDGSAHAPPDGGVPCAQSSARAFAAHRGLFCFSLILRRRGRRSAFVRVFRVPRRRRCIEHRRRRAPCYAVREACRLPPCAPPAASPPEGVAGRPLLPSPFAFRPPPPSPQGRWAVGGAVRRGRLGLMRSHGARRYRLVVPPCARSLCVRRPSRPPSARARKKYRRCPLCPARAPFAFGSPSALSPTPKLVSLGWPPIPLLAVARLRASLRSSAQHPCGSGCGASPPRLRRAGAAPSSPHAASRPSAYVGRSRSSVGLRPPCGRCPCATVRRYPTRPAARSGLAPPSAPLAPTLRLPCPPRRFRRYGRSSGSSGRPPAHAPPGGLALVDSPLRMRPPRGLALVLDHHPNP